MLANPCSLQILRKLIPLKKDLIFLNGQIHFYAYSDTIKDFIQMSNKPACNWSWGFWDCPVDIVPWIWNRIFWILIFCSLQAWKVWITYFILRINTQGGKMISSFYQNQVIQPPQLHFFLQWNEIFRSRILNFCSLQAWKVWITYFIVRINTQGGKIISNFYQNQVIQPPQLHFFLQWNEIFRSRILNFCSLQAWKVWITYFIVRINTQGDKMISNFYQNQVIQPPQLHFLRY